ncbi:hypothetical protein DRJ16_01400 [Candidatus Woesearchaeota archaeon]|nr:MAG: hypothetical protein DRJ16_01400 [Candidatus Woesearchaeota archaeon]
MKNANRAKTSVVNFLTHHDDDPLDPVFLEHWKKELEELLVDHSLSNDERKEISEACGLLCEYIKESTNYRI